MRYERNTLKNQHGFDNQFFSGNSSLRDECLNVNRFTSLIEAQRLLEAWRQDYNESRPHSALNDLTPAEYARKIKAIGQHLRTSEREGALRT